jgi:hypothetical protein
MANALIALRSCDAGHPDTRHGASYGTYRDVVHAGTCWRWVWKAVERVGSGKMHGLRGQAGHTPSMFSVPFRGLHVVRQAVIDGREGSLDILLGWTLCCAGAGECV